MLEFLTTIAYICAFIVIAPAFLLILFDVSFLAVVSAYNIFKRLESKYLIKKYSSKKIIGFLTASWQLSTTLLKKKICIYCNTKNRFTTDRLIIHVTFFFLTKKKDLHIYLISYYILIRPTKKK
ncbi:hypothetical protein RCL_jg20190.t1 [Rhizophagus clarus]|uniref:Uncharacterized protein n=1 Tax=Rhizophagus clarus TaxID=94130 RepID=A0A8H3QCS5_9GLOM|nr:hypothetical protein RCL_jg20190.t1 [Rhizophagus clarus]